MLLLDLCYPLANACFGKAASFDYSLAAIEIILLSCPNWEYQLPWETHVTFPRCQQLHQTALSSRQAKWPRVIYRTRLQRLSPLFAIRDVARYWVSQPARPLKTCSPSWTERGTIRQRL